MIGEGAALLLYSVALRSVLSKRRATRSKDAEGRRESKSQVQLMIRVDIKANSLT